MLIPRLKNNIKEIPYNKENVLKYKSPDNLLRHARTDKGCTGVMLISGNSLIGYVGWQGEMIIALEVTNQFRGQGYGEYLVKRAIDSGCTRLTVDSNNIPAINLYKKMGFVVDEDNGKRLEMKQKSFSSISVGKRTGILRNLIFVSPLPKLERELLDPIIPRNFLTSKKYIEALKQLDIEVKKRYNWGAKSRTNGAEDFVLRLAKEGLKPTEISKKMGITLNRVYYLLNKTNEKFDNRNRKHDHSKVKSLKEEGLSAKEISEELDIPLRTVYNILNKK